MKRIGNVCGSLCSIALLMLLATSCGTVNVPLQITHPAEISMTPYKQVAISEFGGNMGANTEDAIKSQLVELGRFQVVERSRLDQIMKELNLSQSDLADAGNRAKLGKLLSASAMIAGRAEGKYDEKLSQGSSVCYNASTKKAEACTVNKRKGVFNTEGSIDVIDIQTGQILKSKPFNASSEETTTAVAPSAPEAIDKESLAKAVLVANVGAFLKAISPWAETVQAPFQTDKTIPELETGVNKAKIGDMKEAVDIFAGAAKAAEGNDKIKPTSIAKAYFNLGLSYQYTDEFDKAIDAFKRAYTLHPSDMFLNEKANAEKLKAEKKKLAEQGM